MLLSKLFQSIGTQRGYIFLCSVVLYLLSVVFPIPELKILVSISSILCLMVAFPYSSLVSKGLSVVFITAGFYLAHASAMSWFRILESFGSMLSLLGLFTVVPLLAIPVMVGHYETSVTRVLQKRHLSAWKLYFTISGLSYLLASLMNIATIPMMYHSVREVVEHSSIQQPKQFLVQSIVTGYAMPLVWSPVAAVVAAVVNVTSVTWLTVFPITLSISFAGLALSVLSFSWHGRSPSDSSDAPMYIAATLETLVSERSGARAHSLWQIPISILLFISSMLVIQHWSGWSMLEVISLVSIPFAAVWCILLGQGKQFATQLGRHHATVRNLHSTFAVFTAAGFFVSALQHVSAYTALDSAFVQVSRVVGPSVFIALIPIIVIALSLIGFHPVVSIALLGTSLHPSVLHMSPIWLATALFGGGVLTFIVSPFNATLNVTGTMVEESPWTIMRWNIPFCISFLVLIILVVGVGQLLWPG